MRIAYLTFTSLRNTSGVSRKILKQLSIWRTLGANARLFVVSPFTAKHDFTSEAVEMFPYSGLSSRILATRKASDAIFRFRPDIIYLRFGVFHPQLITLFRSAPAVAEINSSDRNEYRETKPRLIWAYHSIMRRLFFKYCAGFVCVTRELEREVSEMSVRSIVISNGIEEFFPRSPALNDSPSVFFIGTPGYSWHGIDKLMWLASQKPHWRFHIIGYRQDELGVKEVKNVQAYGPMDFEQYRCIANTSDVAVGTLALHRKGMEEACPLKVRETLGLGLPTIIGYEDTDQLNRFPFVLRLPNREDSVRSSVTLIEQFLMHWRGRAFDSRTLTFMDSQQKERDRLAFFRSFINASRS